MPVTVFYTPISYKGSTKEIFTKAMQSTDGPDYSGMLYLAPAPLKILDAYRIFHEIAGNCYVPPLMTTIRQISNRLFALYDNRKLMPQSMIPAMISAVSGKSLGYSSLIAGFINEIKQHQPGADSESLAQNIASVCSRLGIPEEVAERSAEALRIMNRYQETLNKCNAVDENDALAICPEIIRKKAIRYDCIFIDGFISLNVAEEAIVKALIENTRDTLICMPYDSIYSSITEPYIEYINNNFIIKALYLNSAESHLNLAHHAYAGREEEMEGIARSIKSLFLAGALPDLEKVTVVFPDIGMYLFTVERIFGKYGIPFTIVSKKPLAKTKPVQDILALLNSVANDYPRLQFSQFLISPYFRALPASFKEYIPSLCISSGFMKGKKAWLKLTGPAGNYARAEFISGAVSQTIEKDLARAFRKLSHLESIRSGASYSVYGEAIMDLLRAFDFDDVSGNGGIMNRVNEIISNLALIDGVHGAAMPDLQRFTEALRHCLMQASVPEKDDPGVRIASFMDASMLEPEYLYFAGLRDGDFPSKPDIDHIMPDNLRTALGLVNMEKYLLLQKFLFTKALSSSRRFHLSYSTMDGDRLFLPSSYLTWDEEIWGPVSGIFSREENLIMKGCTKSGSLISDMRTTDRRVINRLFGNHSAIRVTDIDAYRMCPRKFFIERLLSLKPLEITKFEIEALTLGSLVHKIMQELIPASIPDINAFILHAGQKIDAILSANPLDEYWKGVVKDALSLLLPDIYMIEKKIAADGYSVAGAEVSAMGEVLPGITLKGKIDRINQRTHSEGIKFAVGRDGMSVVSSGQSANRPVIELIDYKTGSAPYSGLKILSQGFNLQLILYAALMKTKGIDVERAGIYSLHDVSLWWIPTRDDEKNGRTIEDYLATALRFLEETTIEMRNGKFPAQPLNDQTCRNCHERSYCPYVQKTVLRQVRDGKIS